MASKTNPNVKYRDALALTVPCGYCKAAVGVRCWTLRAWGDHRAVERDTHAPHKSRIKALWRKQFKENK